MFERSKHEMMTNVLNLDDRRVGAVLTPRSDVVFLDVREAIDINREKLRHHPHAVFPLCRGGLDDVVGFIRSARLLERCLDNGPMDLLALAEPALFVPETTTLMTLLEQFKRTHLPVALVVDEFGNVEGLVSLTDVVSSIVGEFPTEAGDEPMIVRRADGSVLLDGALDLDTVLRTLDVESLLTEEEQQQCHTLGGLVMVALGRVPQTGDTFERGGLGFEVVDMDGNRVDRVLVTRNASPHRV